MQRLTHARGATCQHPTPSAQKVCLFPGFSSALIFLSEPTLKKQTAQTKHFFRVVETAGRGRWGGSLALWVFAP